jgi:Crp-like helix-turn-helix domain
METPERSTIPLATQRLNPVPFSPLVVKNGSKMRGRLVAEMPTPLSGDGNPEALDRRILRVRRFADANSDGAAGVDSLHRIQEQGREHLADLARIGADRRTTRSVPPRLARLLLLMADHGKPEEPETLIPNVTQETLAEMIGTTRSRVSFFMNRFRALGYIEYKRRIRVHKSLLNVVLKDELSGENASNPRFVDPLPSAAHTTKRTEVA